jgi:hypothetical protein
MKVFHFFVFAILKAKKGENLAMKIAPNSTPSG